jgi:hypothetical protein
VIICALDRIISFLTSTNSPLVYVVLIVVVCVKRTGLTHKCCKNAQVELAIVACVKRTGLTHKCCKNAQVELAIVACVTRTGLTHRLI